jgi:hypothetical protein
VNHTFLDGRLRASFYHDTGNSTRENPLDDITVTYKLEETTPANQKGPRSFRAVAETLSRKPERHAW